jgi:FKBP-type peptidyl-prolyl cis-trans isomerase 2
MKMRMPMANNLTDRTMPKAESTVSQQESEGLVVGENTRVTLNFVVRDDTDSVLDDMYETTPFQFIYGQGDLPPGLEQGILGLTAGQTKKIVVPPDQAYGKREQDLVIRIHKDKLPSEDCIVGSRYRRLNADGESELFTVMGFLGDWVFLDRNHPWAGKQLKYQVRIVKVLSHAYEACD